MTKFGLVLCVSGILLIVMMSGAMLFNMMLGIRMKPFNMVLIVFAIFLILAASFDAEANQSGRIST
jgi:hypothetical protein